MTQMPTDVRAAIQDLMVDYAYAVDALNNIDDLLDLFAEDAQGIVAAAVGGAGRCGPAGGGAGRRERACRDRGRLCGGTGP